MTSYFSKYPKIFYDMTGTGTSLQSVTDIIHRVDFINHDLRKILIFFPYTVKDGETPEIIADKLYGSPEYYWVVLYANKIYNLWSEWPRSYDQFVAYLTKKYGSPDIAQSTIYQYQDQFGNIIDETTYNETTSDGSISVSVIDYETQLNDSKKQILLVDPQYVNILENQLDQLLAAAASSS